MGYTLEKQLTKLRKMGFKITPHIRAILDIFDVYPGYMSVVEIQQQLLNQNLTLGFPTIYRILDRLEQSGVILSFKTSDRQVYYFQCRSEDTSQHHHHFMCSRCHKVEEVGMCVFKDVERLIERDLGACVMSHSLHIEGLCSTCKNCDVRVP
jgi:Fe2+ or Zn2+ uptake regulation protein